MTGLNATNQCDRSFTWVPFSRILSTAILTSLGSVVLATSAQGHHGGGHRIEVDKSGQAYEVVEPNWNKVATPISIAAGLSILGLGSYCLGNYYRQRKSSS